MECVLNKNLELYYNIYSHYQLYKKRIYEYES